MRDLTPLCLLAKKHETDKGGRHLRYGGRDSTSCHEYTPVYWDLFHERADQVQAVAEIGIDHGQSMRLWSEFFPNAQIIGLEWDNELLFHEGRIHCYLADQRDPITLHTALIKAGQPQYDLIIDDGSHETDHQISSMKVLLPWLAPDGVYVVEDLQDDCHPEIVGQHVPAGYVWDAIKAPYGIGQAHCPCSECGGTGPEQLLVIHRG